LIATELEAFWQTGIARGPADTHLTGRHPWYAVHGTRDGGAVAVGAVEPAFHATLCRSIGHPELAARQHAEGAERADAWAAFRECFAARTRDEAMAALGDAETCASPVLSVAEVAASPLMERAVRPAPAPADATVRSPIRLPLPAPVAERRGPEVLARFGFT